MKKFRCLAEVYRIYGDKNGSRTEHWTEKEIVFDTDGWSALDKFESRLCKDYGQGYIDDLRFEDLGPCDVYIFSTRDSYSPHRDTMTVKELIDLLSKFDPDSKVYTVDDHALSPEFGSLSKYLVVEETGDEDW